MLRPTRTEGSRASRTATTALGMLSFIGMAAGLEKDTDGLGAVGGYRELNQYTELGGSLTVFALPNQ